MLDKETVEKAADRAATQASEQVLKSIPKTASGLEKDYNQIKKDTEQVYKYISNIPVDTIEKLYKSSELQSELLSGILLALGKHGFETKESATQTVNMLLGFSKADGFDMTLMFIDDKDKQQITSMIANNKKLKVDSKIQLRFD